MYVMHCALQARHVPIFLAFFSLRTVIKQAVRLVETTHTLYNAMQTLMKSGKVTVRHGRVLPGMNKNTTLRSGETQSFWAPTK